MGTQLSFDRGSAEALSVSKQEPTWLTVRRAEAAEKAQTLDWPQPEKMRIARWNLEAFGNYKAAEPAAGTAELPAALQELLSKEEDASGLLVQRNSSRVLNRMNEKLAAKGVIFTDLETAAREHVELVQKHLFSVVDPYTDKLTARHAALWTGGVFVYVPKNVEVELPLQALLYSDDAEATFAPHILLIADTNSRVTYVDNVVSAFAGEVAPSVHQSVTEVIVKAGARVQFATVHHLAESVTDLSVRRAKVEQDGRIEWIVGDLHDGNILSDTVSVLEGSGATSDAKVITIGARAQKMSVTTQAVHVGRSTDSNMVTRAVMKEQATAIINGITKIEKGATKANGVQTEKVLMLSPKARGDANPILLIDEDDVTAGHAASVGQVNPEQIHYLMSRGIAKEDAERLIIYGFLAPVVSEVPIPSVREQLQRLLERKLES
ncbi:Fe-S cluster assembly protein SufD [Paenibacillus sp. IB182496]|uniref:Fe-S cluster assembly protein SufD n=1 Tax=Paenibacillus sabuli TaxID=2772509 RepID=A0A927BZH8_9BACL|nr:Fe-S cluster assembly protein SufD [Paenibacillus sabuli]MBD2848244.1 Fe-S cluster assembly protein SufD [Paenibacillus sabuli]